MKKLLKNLKRLIKSKITIKIIIEDPNKPINPVKPKKERNNNLEMTSEPTGRIWFNKALIPPKKNLK